VAGHEAAIRQALTTGQPYNIQRQPNLRETASREKLVVWIEQKRQQHSGNRELLEHIYGNEGAVDFNYDDFCTSSLDVLQLLESNLLGAIEKPTTAGKNLSPADQAAAHRDLGELCQLIGVPAPTTVIDLANLDLTEALYQGIKDPARAMPLLAAAAAAPAAGAAAAVAPAPRPLDPAALANRAARMFTAAYTQGQYYKAAIKQFLTQRFLNANPGGAATPAQQAAEDAILQSVTDGLPHLFSHQPQVVNQIQAIPQDQLKTIVENLQPSIDFLRKRTEGIFANNLSKTKLNVLEQPHDDKKYGGIGVEVSYAPGQGLKIEAFVSDTLADPREKAAAEANLPVVKAGLQRGDVIASITLSDTEWQELQRLAANGTYDAKAAWDAAQPHHRAISRNGQLSYSINLKQIDAETAGIFLRGLPGTQLRCTVESATSVRYVEVEREIINAKGKHRCVHDDIAHYRGGRAARPLPAAPRGGGGIPL
jgi:C-terminal processing protease CtpA/Prc